MRAHYARTAKYSTHSYAKTLNLPASKFPNRPNKSLLQTQIYNVSDKLYRYQKINNKGKKYILHDGPPYSNGNLHIGHALNKILKDVINRFNVLAGRNVHYVPGWDCHGLPIESAALKKARKEKIALDTPNKRRGLARDFANHWMHIQKETFRSFAIMADWDNKDSLYRTFDPKYVVRQLRVFASLMQAGLVRRQCKPIYWSVETGSALAESELKYGNRTSTALYVVYPLICNVKGVKASLVIWTTTPWTLPAHRAICVNRHSDYCLVPSSQGHLVVASSLASTLSSEEPVARFKGSHLIGLEYTCPLTSETRTIYEGDHVTDISGTGLVHTAPGHGKEDYLVGLKEGIEVFSPIDNKGRYTDDLPKELSCLVGLDARTEGQEKVMELLHQKNAILKQHKYEHSVPLDWRTDTPVMIRSTPQFFIDLSDVRSRAHKSLESVTFIPKQGLARLSAFLDSRTEWCVSRQRVWGVPIPVLHHKDTLEALQDPEVTKHIIDKIEAYGDQGIDRWFEAQADISEWLPPSSSVLATDYIKGTDTMDVWFDSGTSWTQFNPQELPVEYYLEGSDQHRGWFQSSLLTHVAVSEGSVAPYKKVITHGFVLDEKQQKMSKSLGNIVAPQDLINGNKRFQALGVDGLRLLLAQCDYTSDISISPTVVSQVASTMKKFRLTFKFLLGNLEGYTPPKQIPELSPLDRYALSQLSALNSSVFGFYEEQNFNNVLRTIQTHMNGALSSFYFDAAKDILYTDSRHGNKRLAVQYVLSEILSVYVRIVAPVTPLLAQEVWDMAPDFIKDGKESPFHAGYKVLSSAPSTELDQDFEKLLAVRKSVTQTVELARSDSKVGSSLACDVYISPEHPESAVLQRYAEHLPSLFIASKVHLSVPPKDLEWCYESSDVCVGPPTGHKCPRCWQYNSDAEETLCERCDSVVHQA